MIAGAIVDTRSNPGGQVQDLVRAKYFWSDIKKPVYLGHDETPLITTPGVAAALTVWSKGVKQDTRGHLIQFEELKKAIELDISVNKLRAYAFWKEREGYLKASRGLGKSAARILIPIGLIVVVLFLIVVFGPMLMQSIRSMVPTI